MRAFWGATISFFLARTSAVRPSLVIPAFQFRATPDSQFWLSAQNTRPAPQEVCLKTLLPGRSSALNLESSATQGGRPSVWLSSLGECSRRLLPDHIDIDIDTDTDTDTDVDVDTQQNVHSLLQDRHSLEP